MCELFGEQTENVAIFNPSAAGGGDFGVRRERCKVARCGERPSAGVIGAERSGLACLVLRGRGVMAGKQARRPQRRRGDPKVV